MRYMRSNWTAIRRGVAALIVVLAATTPPLRPVFAEDRPDFTSRVPQYTFAETLEEQQKQLRRNPMLQRFAESRKKLSTDRHRPVYHYVNPEGRLNDPNGLCYWQDRWHLFYQAYPPEDPRQHWGHAVSDDLIHWRDLPLAIYPNPEAKCFSGSTFVEEDRVIAAYHGVKAGTMVAVSSDPLLLNWTKVTGDAVMPFPEPGEPKPPYNIFDPCIWRQGDYYYILTAGTLPDGPAGQRVRAEFLHRSKDLATWEYLHPFLENDQYGLVGDDGACPYFWPIENRHILIHYSHMSGGKYILGNYDTSRDKFVVENGGDFNFGASRPGGVHAPSAFPDGRGRVVVIFNMNSAKPRSNDPYEWNQIMSLPRRLTLAPGNVRNPLKIEPAGDIESVRGKHQHVGTTRLPANEEIVLENVRGNSMEIIAQIVPQHQQTVELNVLRSSDGREATRIVCFRDAGYRRASAVSIDTTRSTLDGDVHVRPPETAQVTLGRNEPIKLRVFIDRSVVEVFVNERQCLGLRVYPTREDSVGVSLRAHGQDATLESLDAWQMKCIYGEEQGADHVRRIEFRS
ncbi:MAG: glycoside hydrolase family 32 protein [Pirellulaceae bacterium]